ncbi:hypothetical protein BT63DRAFT_483514 [Microthyrium microscopicum]|uniref:Uncharacterized protein n=1 Tax=Microthyrium microscopicum TaxID=703497 RepID=A0A6A6TZG6_9PEZI|nr:hypothetical protein BT63DRAFT_483514 [Microthyrium microscopicum]
MARKKKSRAGTQSEQSAPQQKDNANPAVSKSGGFQKRKKRTDQIRTGQIPPGQIAPGQIAPGQIAPGQIAPGQNTPSQIPPRQPRARRGIRTPRNLRSGTRAKALEKTLDDAINILSGLDLTATSNTDPVVKTEELDESIQQNVSDVQVKQEGDDYSMGNSDPNKPLRQARLQNFVNQIKVFRNQGSGHRPQNQPMTPEIARKAKLREIAKAESNLKQNQNTHRSRTEELAKAQHRLDLVSERLSMVEERLVELKSELAEIDTSVPAELDATVVVKDEI